jgi:hypothetical protein
MIEESIVALLSASTTITGLIGPNAIWPVMIPQTATYPCIKFSTITGMSDFDLDGVTNLLQVRIQVEAWANSYGGAKTLQAAIKNVLDGYAGTPIAGGVTVISCYVVNSIDFFEADSRQFRAINDYMIRFS